MKLSVVVVAALSFAPSTALAKRVVKVRKHSARAEAQQPAAPSQPQPATKKPTDDASAKGDRSDLQDMTGAGAASRAQADKDKAQAREQIAPVKFGLLAPGEDSARDAAAAERRDEAIGELVRIIPTFEDGDQKADLLYRLAELYWEKAKYTYFLEFRAYDAEVEAWSKAGSTGPEPKLASEKSDALKKQAIGVYDQILERYPSYKRNDEVLFNKATSLYESGDKKQAVELYAQLIRHYPQSSYLPDTYLALGEHYFSNNELHKAIVSYQKAVQTNKARIYGFALYKLAWCDYNAQDYPAALQKFKDVIVYSEQQSGKKKNRDRVQLRQEALKDMLLTFSQMDAIDEAKDYYAQKLSKDELPAMLGRLGGLYEDQGKYDLAVKTYKLVNQEWPNAAKAPQYQAAIINAYAAMQKRDKVREEVKRLVSLYKPGAAWAQANQQNKVALSEAYDLTERSLRELVLEFHAEAQKVAKDGDRTTAERSYVLARDLYREYLEAFAESENAYKMRFNYAEILFREKSYEQAAGEFDKVAAQNPKGKYLKDAAFSSVQAWEMITEGGAPEAKSRLKELGAMQRLEKGKDYAELPIPAAYQKLAAACERFVKVLPNDPDVVKVKFKEARIFFIHNHFEEAGKRFGEIIERWPNDKLGRLAATFVLEGFNVREKWVELAEYARVILSSKELIRDEQFAREVQDFHEGAKFKQVQALEKSGELAQAGQKYRAFADEFPRSKWADLALYNAVVISDRAHQLDVALSAAERLLRDYPGTKTRESVQFMVASFYERTGELEKALKGYEAYVAKFPKGEKLQDAAFNVALFQDALGMSKQALGSFLQYLKAYPRAADALAIYVKIGGLYERTGDSKKAFDHYAELDKHYADAPAVVVFETREKMAKIAKQKGDLGEYKVIWDRYQRLRAELKRDERIAKIAAAARFELFEPHYQEYIAIQLKLPQKALTESLVKKAKLLAEVEKEYAQILSLGNGEYGIAALARIGMAYHDFSKALFDAPVPPGLTEEQREIYLSELQSKAFPIEEKAIEAYEKALEKAKELHVYTEWTLKAQERLAQFKPSEFPEVRKFAAQPSDRFTTAAVVGE